MHEKQIFKQNEIRKKRLTKTKFVEFQSNKLGEIEKNLKIKNTISTSKTKYCKISK